MKNTERYLLPVLPTKIKNLFEEGIDPKGEVY
mgnify:CR=1 FL=1